MRYLVITYVTKPDGKIDEVMTVTKNLKKNDITMANVIMDFKLRKLDRCFVDRKKVDASWDTVYAYYSELYPASVSRLAAENGWSGEIISPTESNVVDADVIDIDSTRVQ